MRGKSPTNAVNSVNTGPLISSIQTNIEIVRSLWIYQKNFKTSSTLRRKFLWNYSKYSSCSESDGGWLYNNGLRFKAWVEVYILVTKLWDLWQVLVDVFNDYEAECGVCRNERWNLQHWLWIIISMIIRLYQLSRCLDGGDIELDFSDIDLSLDIAYPVFNLSFYPVSLPDAPIPTISWFNVSPMPLLPRIPDLNIDVNIPVIQLPKLPDLPPPPKILNFLRRLLLCSRFSNS